MHYSQRICGGGKALSLQSLENSNKINFWMSLSGASFSPASYLSCYRERKVLSFTFVYLPVTAKSFGQTSSLNRKNKHNEW